MSNFWAQVIERYQCPDCKGVGEKPYPSFYPCQRCQGSGHLRRVMLTYPETTDTVGNLVGRLMFAGYIEEADICDC